MKIHNHVEFITFVMRRNQLSVKVTIAQYQAAKPHFVDLIEKAVEHEISSTLRHLHVSFPEQI